MEYAEGVILGADSRTTTGKGNVVGINHVKFQFFFLLKNQWSYQYKKFNKPSIEFNDSRFEVFVFFSLDLFLGYVSRFW